MFRIICPSSMRCQSQTLFVCMLLRTSMGGGTRHKRHVGEPPPFFFARLVRFLFPSYSITAYRKIVLLCALSRIHTICESRSIHGNQYIWQIQVETGMYTKKHINREHTWELTLSRNYCQIAALLIVIIRAADFVCLYVLYGSNTAPPSCRHCVPYRFSGQPKALPRQIQCSKQYQNRNRRTYRVALNEWPESQAFRAFIADPCNIHSKFQQYCVAAPKQSACEQQQTHGRMEPEEKLVSAHQCFRSPKAYLNNSRAHIPVLGRRALYTLYRECIPALVRSVFFLFQGRGRERQGDRDHCY